MVHNRLSRTSKTMAYTMYGLCPHRCALQLKEEVVDKLSTTQMSAILALDEKRAFDGVSLS